MPILTRAVYKTVKEFAEYYSIGKTRAYELVSMPGFPMKRIGRKGIRVDMTKVEEFMDKHFNY